MVNKFQWPPPPPLRSQQQQQRPRSVHWFPSSNSGSQAPASIISIDHHYPSNLRQWPITSTKGLRRLSQAPAATTNNDYSLPEECYYYLPQRIGRYVITSTLTVALCEETE